MVISTRWDCTVFVQNSIIGWRKTLFLDNCYLRFPIKEHAYGAYSWETAQSLRLLLSIDIEDTKNYNKKKESSFFILKFEKWNLAMLASFSNERCKWWKNNVVLLNTVEELDRIYSLDIEYLLTHLNSRPGLSPYIYHPPPPPIYQGIRN